MDVYSEIFNVLTRGDLRMSAYRHEFVVRRINDRISALKLNNETEYLRYLYENYSEAAIFLEHFLVHYSEFYRDELGMTYLANVLFPEMLIRKTAQNQNRLRLWSAGCASGEEIYSISMLLKQLLEHQFTNFSFKSFASDVNSEILNKAKEGCYNQKSVEKLPFYLLKKYFELKDSRYIVKDELKQEISFSQHNLLSKTGYVPSESIFGGFDLVICRNVLIYFSTEYQEQALLNLHKSLNTGGVLYMGENDLLRSNFKNMFEQIVPWGTFYKKL